MYLLVLDTETTGIPEDDPTPVMIELAAALYSVERKTTLWQFGTILNAAEENPVEHINGISAGDLADAPTSLEPLRIMIDNSPAAAAVVAHNAEFDQGFVMASPHKGIFSSYRWVCSCWDFEYDKCRGSRHLSHLLTDHGLPGHTQRHRALADVLDLCDLLSCLNNLEEQVQDALKPQGLWQSLQPFAKNKEAKDRGFGWKAEVKQWQRKMPLDFKVPEDWPFRVRLIKAL